MLGESVGIKQQSAIEFNLSAQSMEVKIQGYRERRAGELEILSLRRAEGMGLEPTTGFPAPHFQCGR